MWIGSRSRGAIRSPPTSSDGGGTSPSAPAMQRPPMRTTLPAGPVASSVLLRTSNTIAGDPVYGGPSACSAACNDVVGDPLGRHAQAPEVGGAADVQLERSRLV